MRVWHHVRFFYHPPERIPLKHPGSHSAVLSPGYSVHHWVVRPDQGAISQRSLEQALSTKVTRPSRGDNEQSDLRNPSVAKNLAVKQCK
jgi:hypothetical protein